MDTGRHGVVSAAEQSFKDIVARLGHATPGH
jgi:hypothetical protein